MGKRITLGCVLFAFLFLFSGWSFAQTTPGTGILEGLTGPQCCVCFNEDCCFLIDADACDEQGNLRNPELLEAFFNQLDIQGGEICNLCTQCALNEMTPEEDDQFLTVCDICVFEGFIEQFQCQLLPPEVVDIFVPPGNCEINFRSGPMNAVALLVGIFLLGTFSWRKRKKVRIKK